MFISINKIKDWQDLQEQVKEFFLELGYEAHTNYPIQLLNGAKANVDVFAVKGDSPLAQKILFECKYWNSDVPRAIVQSFKMDVQEAGANFGIIVSKKGFQSGAYQGISLTTVKLYTFEELQEVFAVEWAKIHVEPLKHLYNQLADEYQALSFGTPQRRHFEKTLFNPTLQLLRTHLEESTMLSLSIFKDYYEYYKDPLWVLKESKKISFITPSRDGTFQKIEFYDARTLMFGLKKLLIYGLEEWFNYRKVFSDEVNKLTFEEQQVLFDTIPLKNLI